jgi:hypothetical protein
MNEVNDFARTFEKEMKVSKRDAIYMIKVMSPQGPFTPNGYYTNFKELVDEDDYFEGKVKIQQSLQMNFLKLQFNFKY